MNVLFLSHNYGPIKNALFIDCFVLILEAVSYFRNTTPVLKMKFDTKLY